MGKLWNLFNNLISTDTRTKNESETSIMIPIVMPDGTVDKYDPNFMITDGENCVVCGNDHIYHTWFKCDAIRKAFKYHTPIYGMTRQKAESDGKFYCKYCQQNNTTDTTVWDSEDDE